ncbi:uncharacterized protein LOC108117421 [Drosophila eugracilis]|uniref:uncharacterized protein LOC108117421 n=1 Tax=Drosophila eugracilis TaxID=29029 RepID=UPI0007E8A5C4|nr:uncharacterized protein LOC108117421 [Drosophila eugracilis]
MEGATLWRLQLAHQRQYKEWDRIGRRLKRLTGKKSSDLLLHDPLLQPSFVAINGQRMWVRMSGGQQVPIPIEKNRATQKHRNEQNKSGIKIIPPKNPLDLVIVGQQLHMHQPPGRRHVRLENPSSRTHLQMEEYVHFHSFRNYYKFDHWGPYSQEESYAVIDARFMMELFNELLMDVSSPTHTNSF